MTGKKKKKKKVPQENKMNDLIETQRFLEQKKDKQKNID